MDLCCGIGGFRLGFEREGYKCVFSCENNSAACEVYKENFRDFPYGDMFNLDLGGIPYADVVVAGIPCQAFSCAGKRKGFDDIRGTLFFEVMKIVRDKKPKAILLENVKGLLVHDKGNTYKVMKEIMQEQGYTVTEKILNSKDFGLAQSRERLFIVALLGDVEFDFDRLMKGKKVVLNDILDKTNKDYIDENTYELLPQGIEQKSGLIFKGYLKGKGLRGKGVDRSRLELSRTHRQPNRIYDSRGCMCTIMSQETSGRYWVYTGEGVRKLTKNEVKRLMGIPEEFKIYKDFYSKVGNSVCVPIVTEIAKVLRVYLT